MVDNYVESIIQATMKAKGASGRPDPSLSLIRFVLSSGHTFKDGSRQILLNRLVSKIGGRYLEIGVYQGYALFSSLYNSTTNHHNVAIDNWSILMNNKEEFVSTLKENIENLDIDVELIEKDQREVTADDLQIEKYGKFRIFIYDSDAKLLNQTLEQYLPYLEDDFIVCSFYEGIFSFFENSSRFIVHHKNDVICPIVCVSKREQQ